MQPTAAPGNSNPLRAVAPRGVKRCICLRANPANRLALLLLMLRIFADDHYAALALDYLALFAHFLDRRSDFHWNTSLKKNFYCLAYKAKISLISNAMLYARE